MFKNVIAAAATVAAFSFGGMANATTVDLTYNGFEATGGTDPVQSVYVSGGGVSGWFNAGGFDMSDSVGNFVAWCIDLRDSIGSVGETNTYTEQRPGRVSDAEEGWLNQLFTGFASMALDSAVNSAAFQVAVWEIVYDGNLDLGQGGFYASGNAAVTSLAQNWLDAVNSGRIVGTYDLTFYEDLQYPRRQDLVTGVPGGNPIPDPVPLPAGVVLLLGGLGALGLARRKRKAA